MAENPPSIDLESVEPYLSGETFDQVVVGSRFRTASRTVTEADLIAFVTLAGLTEPLFLDEQGSSAAGYPGRLVPGTLTFAYAEGLLMQTGAIHNTGIAFLSANVEVTGPVFVGDTLTVVVEVTEARPTKAGNRGIVTTRNTVVKRDGSVVMIYHPVRMIRGRQ
ncbi:MAG TPA: MaoC/PaaZ C-terminal domain-containing protein [Mycobacteriales bacterium]|nr:MaoC/PaaZ C-terminal domain-containing protein [Mycobacteriales bacterium]